MNNLDVANAYRNALIDVSSIADRDLVSYMELAKDLPQSEWKPAMREGMNALLMQYGSVASLVGAEFYDVSRTLTSTQTGTDYIEYQAQPIDVEQFIPEFNSGVQFAISRAPYTEYDELINLFSSILTRGTNNVSRETVVYNGADDVAFVYPVRVPRANACSWCKYMATIAEQSESTDGKGFHNHCRCVIMPTFKNQKIIELRQKGLDEFEREYRDLEEKAVNGDIEQTRTVRRGGKDFYSAVKRDLSVSSRNWRKEFEKKANLTTEQKAIQRESTAKTVDILARKINNGTPLNSRDTRILEAWGVDEKTISEPRSVQVNSGSKKDILSLMRRENHSS